MAERKFDPDSVVSFRDYLIGKLDELEGDGGPIETMKNGELKYAPAFGLTDSAKQTAIPTYKQSHQTIWNNVQALRQTFYALIDALNKSLEDHGYSEEANVQEMSDREDQVGDTGSSNLNTDNMYQGGGYYAV
ncbi:hypothetical protein L0U85_00655 [Glycomyces sp. L485]|uniref:hypothetical protein n=1 Tax=Glycomyces sp. L485 TaxID=2909235 RepID=UPI001F4B2DE4|nr:hypothetical protein [Glycomyces sp. L485]MCH7229379.1 hypothetical protein [Glycomyces sp. L485]